MIFSKKKVSFRVYINVLKNAFIFIFARNEYFYQQGYIKLSDSDNEVTVKMCITLKKIYSSTNFERAKTVQLISIFLIIRNVPSAVNQHIRMTSG